MRNIIITFFVLCFFACKEGKNSKQVNNSEIVVNAKSINPERTDWRNRRKSYPMTKQVLEAKKSFNSIYSNPSTKDAGLNNWIELGPDNIGGRVRAAVTLSNNRSIIAATAGGGLLRADLNTNTGVWNWSNIDDFNSSLAFSCMAINKSVVNDVIYAGTGEYFAFTNVGLPGDGIYKSIDSGVSWNQLPKPMGSNLYWVSEIAVEENNPNVVYVLENERTQSGNGSSSFQNKIHKSTDGGQTWTSITHFTNRFGNISDFDDLSDIKIDPSNSNHIFVTVQDGRQRDFRLLESLDAGLTFNELSASAGLPFLNHGRGEIFFSKSNPNIIYLSIDNGNGILYKSIDNGLTWVNQYNGPISYLCNPVFPSICQGNYSHTIWVDPLDEDHVILGGIDLFQSFDGGFSFAQISDWQDFHNGTDTDGDGNVSNSPHADHHFIVESNDYSASNDRLFFCTDGGLSVCNDISNVDINSGWTLMNNNGFNATQFYTGAAANGSYLGGAQDNSFLYKISSSISNLNWTQQSTGDGGFCVVSPVSGWQVVSTQNANLRFRSGSVGDFDFYADFDFVCNCCNPGGTSSLNCDCSTSPFWCECPTFLCCSNGQLPSNGCGSPIGFVVSDNPDFIAPIVRDPNSGTRILVGARRLWDNPNTGNSTVSNITFNSIKSAPSGANTQISAIDVANGDGSTIWVGYNNGDLEYTFNNGTTWSTDISPPSIPFPGFVTDVAINPVNNNKVVVSYGGYDSNNLWISNDGTISNSFSWTNINPGVNVQINAVLWHPTNESWLYIATDFGILASEDEGASWSVTPLYEDNDGPVNTEVSDIFWRESNIETSTELVAATHGRGMWRSNVIRDSLYVDKNTTLPETGSFNSPFDTFQEALDVAGHGSVIIFKSSGNHEEIPANAAPVIADKRIKIVLDNNGSGAPIPVVIK